MSQPADASATTAAKSTSATTATATASPAAASSSGARPSSHGSHATAVRRAPSSRRQPSSSRASHRHTASMALTQQKLAEMGSYAKYFKAITQNPYQVKIRCQCGRSRNMAWMFLCTWCATGTPVKKEKDNSSNKNIRFGGVSVTDQKDEEQNNDDDDEDEQNNNKSGVQRSFLSCDLCAQKMTESYYCPHCLAAFPAHYVKLQTRCTRCVSCPVCTSPLEKIVYSGSTSTSTSSSSSTATSGDSSTSSSSGSSGGKKKDVYLYQCPFCFWSSNIVGLEASESDRLLENLKEKLKKPVDEKTVIMEDIKGTYLTLNEQLRREEEKVEQLKKRFNYKGGRALFGGAAGAGGSGATPSRLMSSKHRKKSTMTLALALAAAGGGDAGGVHGQQASMHNLSALDALEKKRSDRFLKYHTLDKREVHNEEPPLGARFVSQFHLRNVSPLQHRLNEPLHQSGDMDKYVPQRFHLMTKESYRCPNKEECGKYVCKPTLRGRQANYDKRTAVLDYLPRINIEAKSGSFETQKPTVILVMVQNRHLHAAQFKFDASINENDPYCSANIECPTRWFDVDPADIHIKGGTQKKQEWENGKYKDYVSGKEAGLHCVVTPKTYVQQKDVKFFIKCTFKTKIKLKEDKSEKQGGGKDEKGFKDLKELKSLRSKDDHKNSGKTEVLRDVELSYILDFELGPIADSMASMMSAASHEHDAMSSKKEDGIDSHSNQENDNNNNSTADGLM